MKITKTEIAELQKFSKLLSTKAKLILVAAKFFPKMEMFEFNKEEFYRDAYPTLNFNVDKLRIGVANVEGSCYLLTVNYKHKVVIDYSVNNESEIVEEFIMSLGL